MVKEHAELNRDSSQWNYVIKTSVDSGSDCREVETIIMPEFADVWKNVLLQCTVLYFPTKEKLPNNFTL